MKLIRITLIAFLGFTTICWAQTNEGVKTIRDIQYYRNPSIQSSQTKLNLLLPEKGENLTLIIWIGQGAWAYVNKDVEMKICENLAKKGVAVASVGHRLSPALIWEPKNRKGVSHPAHVKDIAEAIKWLYDHGAEYNYDPNNIFVAGYSSGAHLAALVAMDDRYTQKLNLPDDIVKGCIPVGGAFDIPHYRDEIGRASCRERVYAPV